jgi:HlyD family secretion protein
MKDANHTPIARLRRARARWPLRLLVVVVLIGGIGFSVRRALTRQPISVQTVTVERGAVRDEVSSSSAGEVKAEQHATIRAELSARVLSVRHERGQRVKKGEVIVTLDGSDLAARLSQAGAALKAQRAQAAQAAAHAQAAQKTADRAKALAERGAETAKAADDALATSTEAEAAASSSRALLSEAEASLDVARVAKGKTVLSAPFDGLLADVACDVGDHVQAGAAVFEIVDDSRLHVDAMIDETDVGRVRIGQPAALRLDALPEGAVAGRVSDLGPVVKKDDKGARALPIEVEVVDMKEAISKGVRPGMSANVDIKVAEKPDVLSLPTNVIVGRGTKRTVYVVKDGVAHEKPVTIGLSSWERCEVSSGVSVGDVVIANLNVKNLADGVPVRLEGRAP